MWPVTWPVSANVEAADPLVKALAEKYAKACIAALTLHRVGGDPVTIMPARINRASGYYVLNAALPGEYPLGVFYPGVYPSAADLTSALSFAHIEAIDLPAPVAGVLEVRVDGVVLDAVNYRLENDRYLVRTDGGVWPVQGDGFTVTYLNSHPVDEMGAYATGVMAAEWLYLLTRDKKCRLPASVTAINRQGLTFEVARGMFPDGVTGLPEIDAYVMLLNPFGLRVAPRVYSPDLPRHRQVR